MVEESSVPKDGGETRAESPALVATLVELTSSPVEAPSFLERSQCSRQPPSYL